MNVLGLSKGLSENLQGVSSSLIAPWPMNVLGLSNGQSARSWNQTARFRVCRANPEFLVCAAQSWDCANSCLARNIYIKKKTIMQSGRSSIIIAFLVVIFRSFKECACFWPLSNETTTLFTFTPRLSWYRTSLSEQHGCAGCVIFRTLVLIIG